jgi:hypothetical protein
MRILTSTPAEVYTPHVITTLTFIVSATASSTPKITATMPAQIIATKTETIVAPTPVIFTQPTETPAPVRPLPLWQILGLTGLFIVITSVSVIDPRPAALDRLRNLFHQISTQNLQYTSKDDGNSK